MSTREQGGALRLMVPGPALRLIVSGPLRIATFLPTREEKEEGEALHLRPTPGVEAVRQPP